MRKKLAPNVGQSWSNAKLAPELVFRTAESFPAGHIPDFSGELETDWRYRVLLDVLDHFNLDLFLEDPTYRIKVNKVLDLFSDDEFETFRRKYVQRYVMH